MNQAQHEMREDLKETDYRAAAYSTSLEAFTNKLNDQYNFAVTISNVRRECEENGWTLDEVLGCVERGTG